MKSTSYLWRPDHTMDIETTRLHFNSETVNQPLDNILRLNIHYPNKEEFIENRGPESTDVKKKVHPCQSAVNLLSAALI